MSLAYVIGAAVVMGLVTLFCRAAPFLFFRNRKPPAVLDYLQRYMPPMIMTILVINGLKGMDFTKAPWGLAELASAALTAGLHLWKRNVLLSIGLGTGLYMLLIRLV